MAVHILPFQEVDSVGNCGTMRQGSEVPEEIEMNMDTIREWLNRQPFEPFVLKLSNGEAHEVRHPENIALAQTRVIVSYPNSDRVVHVGLIHVNSIEAMQKV